MFLIESPTRDRNDVWVPILFQSVYNAIKTSDYQFGVSAVIITANRNSALSLKDFFDIRLNCRFTTQVATETLLDGLLLSEEQVRMVNIFFVDTLIIHITIFFRSRHD